MNLGDELLGKRPKVELAQERKVMCSSMCKPPWWSGDEAPRCCSFKAVMRVNGRPFCGTHGRVAARTEPTMRDVLKFIFDQRNADTPLWRQIMDAYRRSIA